MPKMTGWHNTCKPALTSLLIAAAPLGVHAQPRFACPVDWSGLTRLSGAGPGGLDMELLGIRVRDWKPEHLDQALRRHDECDRASNNPQSLKDAERKFAVEQVETLKRYLLQRDGNLVRESAAQNAQVQAQHSGSAHVQTDSYGRLVLRYDLRGSGRSEMGCSDFDRFPRPLATLPRQMQDDLPRMYRACVQARQLPASQAETVRKWVDQLQVDRRDGTDFVAAVAALAASPQRQSHQTVKSIEERPLHITDEAIQAAERQLKAMRSAVDARECPAHAKSAGLPPELVSGYYLMEYATPAPILGMACVAARRGVKLKYRSGGVVGTEAIEIKGRRTVEVTFSRQKMHDGAVLLVPVKSKVDGDTQTVTRMNIQLLAHHIRSALNNE